MGERTAERDCSHGSLARSCERCDLEAELRRERERRQHLEAGIETFLGDVRVYEGQVEVPDASVIDLRSALDGDTP